MNLVILPCFWKIIHYGPIKIKEAGVGGVKGGVGGGIYRKQILAVGMDHSSVYNNEN